MWYNYGCYIATVPHSLVLYLPAINQVIGSVVLPYNNLNVLQQAHNKSLKHKKMIVLNKIYKLSTNFLKESN